jgi:zinc transport system substrate-binding protein
MRTAPTLPLACAIGLFTLTSCPGTESQAGGPNPGDEDGPLAVFVVNYPLAYFAERIGGELVTVEFPAPADLDPAFWSPTPDVIGEYQAADLILLNGAGYASWISHASLPDSRLVDTSAAFESELIPVEDAVTHGHGPAGEHSHEGSAFTTWLDPQLAVQQARAIHAALKAKLPENEKALSDGFQRLEADLRELDGRLGTIFAGKSGLPLLGSHPVYQYLRRRYELNLKSLHWEPDEAPDEPMWAELAALRQEHPAALMLWEGEPLPATRERLAEMGVTCVVFDPAGNVPDDGDLLDVMKANAARLEAAL